MHGTPDPERKARVTLACAYASALAFGLGLMAWGLAPLILLRVSRGEAPGLESLAYSATSLWIGGIFLGLSVLIRRRIAWALRTAICVSLVLLTCTALLGFIEGTESLSVFALLFAFNTAFTNWLALTSQRSMLKYAGAVPHRESPRGPTTPARR